MRMWGPTQHFHNAPKECTCRTFSPFHIINPYNSYGWTWCPIRSYTNGLANCSPSFILRFCLEAFEQESFLRPSRVWFCGVKCVSWLSWKTWDCMPIPSPGRMLSTFWESTMAKSLPSLIIFHHSCLDPPTYPIPRHAWNFHIEPLAPLVGINLPFEC
jgi:hypothetical protein